MADRTGGADGGAPPTPTSERRRPLLSELMAELGIVQRGNPLLRVSTKDFDLDSPKEREEARRIRDRLTDTAEKAQKVYEFRTGIGLAAPQIGELRSIAILRPLNAAQIVLVNPVVSVSTLPPQESWSDDDSEGCLSFFDFRFWVPRPNTLEVRYQDTDGNSATILGRDRLARDLMHEVDHLRGVLCTARMRRNGRIALASAED